MNGRIVSTGLVALMATLAGSAMADRTVLSGGTVLEGKATRKGGKVVVETESGVIAVPADSVVRIEKAESIISVFDERYAALKKGDVAGRLQLAEYCRDHDMRGRERQLLLEVLDVETNNGTARARLGYVKTDAGWITFADSQRAKGLVERDGAWRSPGEILELERMQAQASAASSSRAQEDELAARRAQLTREESALDDARRADSERSSFGYRTASSLAFPRIYSSYPVYSSYPAYPAYGAGYYPRRGFTGESIRPRPVAAPSLMPPAAETYSVVKVPYRHP